MAVDLLLHIDNETLIKRYEELGYKKLNDLEYNLTDDDFLVLSAISHRKLTPKTLFKFGLPKSESMQNETEKRYMQERFGK